jgi:hypothetical protein
MLRWGKEYFVTQEWKYSVLEFPAVEDEVVRKLCCAVTDIQ